MSALYKSINTVLLAMLTMGAVLGQQQMTKGEVLAAWRNFQQEQNKDSLFRFQIHKQTRETLDRLLASSVDTLLVYSVSYPGGVESKRDSCSTLYPVDSYFCWRYRGINYLQEVNGNCESGRTKPNDKVIKFLTDNYTKMADEFFMGVIYSAAKDGDGVHISEKITDHEPKYAMLLQLGSRFKYFSFTDGELTDKKSLFYRYNHNLTAYRFFRLIKNQLK